MSFTKGNVIEALTTVMAEMPAIGKDQKADPRQGGYAYRGIEDITRVLQPLLAKHGVVFAPNVLFYEVRDIIVNEKPWTDTHMTIRYDVYGPGGADDKISITTHGIGRDNSDKGANKAATQCLKYALLQVFCISDSADDADAGSPATDAKQTPKVDPLKAKRAELGRVAGEENISPEKAKELLEKWFGKGTTSQDLDLAQLDSAIAGLRNYDEDDESEAELIPAGAGEGE